LLACWAEGLAVEPLRRQNEQRDPPWRTPVTSLVTAAAPAGASSLIG